MPAEDRICGLHIDEMAISAKEEMNFTRGEINGLPTLKPGPTLAKKLGSGEKVLAVKANNILAAGWRNRWVQPVAFDFTAGCHH